MKMTREMIINELAQRGYEVEEYDKFDNGIIKEGIKIDTGRYTQPIFYMNNILGEVEKGNQSVGDIVDRIVEILEEELDYPDISAIFNHDFVLNNVYIGLQRKTEENLVKRKCFLHDVESYLYVRCSRDGSYKLKVNSLETLDLTEDEIWKRAEENTYKNTVIKPLMSLFTILGVEEELDEEYDGPYVLSNEDGFRGAANILDRKFIRDFGRKIGVHQFVVIPSSIHEVLLDPIKNIREVDLKRYENMIKEVNEEQVAQEERLGDRPYILIV